jgi:signal transduction histidine kinase
MFFSILIFFIERYVYAAVIDEKINLLDKKNVLILSSYGSENTISSGYGTKQWTDEIISSINSQFINSKKTIGVKTEYMGLEENFWSQYYELYKKKFSYTKFDVVISLDKDSFDFLIEYGDKLFPNTPVVFSGISSFSKSIGSEHPLFTGIVKNTDVQSTLDIALKFHPNTKEIFVIDDKVEELKWLLPLYRDKVNIVFSDEFNIIKLKEKIKNLPKDTVIYFSATFYGSKGNISVQKASEFLFKDINIPVYSRYYIELNTESVGGMVTYGDRLGKEIGNLALRVLNGEKPNDIPVTEDSSHNYVFNYEKLKKFNIDLKALPKDSDIVNAPKGSYNISKKLILYSVSIVLLTIITGSIFIIISIFKRRRGERMLEELRYYDNLKTNFFSNISHELRTPLNLIFSALQVLESKINGNKEYYGNLEKYIGIMKQNCYRLLRIISNLIDITKIDAGHFFAHFENKDIVNVVENIVMSVVDYVESNDISITFDTDIEEKIMAFDSDAMERILLNLLSNAVKFTPSGGNIRVNIYDKVNSIVISVKDTGLGIAVEKQSYIFEKFVQVDKSLSRNREGSGIGLSLVKELVSIHNGTIELESALGKGSEFRIELPVRLLHENKNSSDLNIYTNENKVERIKIEFSDIYT